MNIILKEEPASLKEVIIFSGKQSKKNNPAISILEKIWKKRRQNGLKKFNQYNYKKHNFHLCYFYKVYNHLVNYKYL